ncbi:MAG: hypothetical protein ABJK25_17895 [Halieaceae bacterium]
MSDTADTEQAENLNEALRLEDNAGLKRTRHLAFHLAVVVVTLCLFAAADSWFALTGLGLAAALSIATGLAAGFVFTSEVHEWFHYLGAKFSGGDYSTPDKMGFFVYDWNFEKNTVNQFFTMSIAGTVGSLVGLYSLFTWLPQDTVGRVAIIAGGAASLGFAAAIEWPVLMRTRQSREPFQELAKTDQQVLTRSTVIGAVVALITWQALT